MRLNDTNYCLHIYSSLDSRTKFPERSWTCLHPGITHEERYKVDEDLVNVGGGLLRC